jgi:nitroreductase
VTEPARLRELATVWRGAGHIAGSAATIALVAPVSQTPPNRVEYDLGQATMSIVLAATDLGIGTGHSAVSDQDRARDVLGLPGDRRCAYLVALGYPADRPVAPLHRIDRRPFEDVVHRERW